MSSTWVMVADSARARLFALDTGVHSVAEIGDYINPAGRRPEDADEQPPPMALDHSRHASEAHGADRDVAATPFARELNAVLQRGRAAHHYQDLILVAPPPFLETLDAVLDKDVRACVAFSLPRGMTGADPQAIFANLPSHVLSPHRGH